MSVVFVEQLMHKCQNRRCRRPILERGHCKDCAQARRETLEMVRNHYTPVFLSKGVKIPEFCLPRI